MPSFLDQLSGRKPRVPTLPTLDLGTEAGKAITANKANLPAAEGLVSQANKFSMDEITKMLESVIPGYSNMVADATGNIQSELKGQIPKDVSGAIQDSAAAKALGGGYAGSGAHGDLVARDLGLTSLALTERGLSSMEGWLKTSASLYEPSMINVSSMFISPLQEAGFDVEERNAQFQRDWMKEQIDAMPAMWSQDLKNAFEDVLSIYSGTPHKSAGDLPAGVSGGLSAGGGEGGASFGFGGSNYSTTFQDSTGNDPGGELGLGSYG